MRGELNWRDYCLRPGEVTAGNSARLLPSGSESFSALLELVRGAKETLLFEVYAFADDAVGRLFAAELSAAAARGVRVFLIYDAIGSILTDRDFFRSLSAAGVTVSEFHPVILWKPYWNWIKRDHRKLVCADGRAALVGGFNITANDAPPELGGRGWKDAGVLVEGPAVKSIEELFWESWRDCRSGQAHHAPPPPPPRPRPPLWKRGFFAGGEERRAEPSGGPGGVLASAVSASGIRNVRSIRRSYKFAIDSAVSSICITNAYFLPDRLIYRRLIRAVRRGVDVRIITPGKTDHPYVRWASWAMFPHMIRNGIKIYEWQGEILHAKTAVIDGFWSSVGSHNLDHRSLHYNMELNLNVLDRGFGRAMEKAFASDLRNCRRVSLEEARGRPFLSRAGSRLLYLVRSWL